MNFTSINILENHTSYCKVKTELPSAYADWYLPKSEGATSGVLNVFNLKMKSSAFLSEKKYQINCIGYSEIIYEFYN